MIGQDISGESEYESHSRLTPNGTKITVSLLFIASLHINLKIYMIYIYSNSIVKLCQLLPSNEWQYTLRKNL